MRSSMKDEQYDLECEDTGYNRAIYIHDGIVTPEHEGYQPRPASMAWYEVILIACLMLIFVFGSACIYNRAVKHIDIVCQEGC